MALARNITKHQAVNYYKKDDYYATKALGIPGLEQAAELQWGGSLSKELGLVGAVDHETLKKVLDGEYPNGQTLRGRREKNGKETKRAGFDIPLEAPKSLSIAALEGGDHKLIELHNLAAEAAIKLTASTIGCRRGKDGQRYEQTGETLYMKTLHAVNREQEPHLHTHAVFFNITKNSDGQLQRSTTDNMFESQKLIQAHYHSVLAQLLAENGYSFTFDKDYIPQLNGFSREHMLAHSKRTTAIDEELKKMGLTRETATAEQKDYVNKKLRKKKEDVTAETPKQWAAASKAAGFDTAKALEASKIKPKDIEARGEYGTRKAEEVLKQALASNTERNFLTTKEKVLARALNLAKGKLSLSKLEEVYNSQVEKGIIVESHGDKRKNTTITTKEALDIEKRIIKHMENGRNSVKPVLSDEKVQELINDKYAHLSDEQRNVFKLIMTTRDATIFISGAAGTGKTTAMVPSVKELRNAGKEVVGLGPQWSAVHALKDAGIDSKTTDSFILNKKEHGGFYPDRVYLVDEAGLMGSEKLEKIQQIAKNQGARIVFVGDTKQYQAVLAGSGAELLEENGISTAKLTKMIRQRNATEPVKVAAQTSLEDARKALEILDKAGLVKEAKKPEVEAVKQIIADGGFKKAFVIAPTHATIAEVTKEARKQTGQADKPQYTLKTFVPDRDRTDSDTKNLEILHTECEGKDIRVRKEYKQLGLAAGETLKLEKVYPESGNLKLKKEDGTEITVRHDKFKNFDIGESKELNVAEGERLRVTGNGFLDNEILKHSRAEIEEIKGDIMYLRFDDGKKIGLDMKKPQELDYGYAGTGHTHQGMTGERVYLVYKLKDYLEKRHFYTDLTRTKDMIKVFAEDLMTLFGKVEKTKKKEQAHDIYKDHGNDHSHDGYGIV